MLASGLFGLPQQLLEFRWTDYRPHTDQLFYLNYLATSPVYFTKFYTATLFLEVIGVWILEACCREPGEREGADAACKG